MPKSRARNSRALRTISSLGGAAALLAILPDVAFAQEGPDTQAYLDNLWVFIAGAMVFFMQAGFALVETGLTRAKNAVNIMAKNFSDALIGITAWFIMGYALAFGGDSGTGFIGGEHSFFLWNQDLSIPAEGGLSVATTFFFQAVFAATATTIVSGAMAERMKFKAYLAFSFLMCAIIYPVIVHWTWGGGWIADLNIGDRHFSDFAGSGIVHMVGGAASLAGVAILGPRIGKYGPNGEVRAIPGHNIPFAILGVFILWLGWFGFNPGSELAADSAVIIVAVNTMLASLGGGLAAALTTWIKSGKPALSMVGNGTLAGLVSITAGCGTVNPIPAYLIGTIGGVIVVFSVSLLDKFRLDDPVGAISVHGTCGAWGVLAIGLWAHNPDAFVETYLGDEYEPTGLFYGGGIQQLVVQFLEVAIILAWVIPVSAIVFFLIKATIGLRVTREEELAGLDWQEHGEIAYAPDVVKADGSVVEATHEPVWLTTTPGG